MDTAGRDGRDLERAAGGSAQSVVEPAPKIVLTADLLRIATYDVGPPDAPVVLAVHGFASSFVANYVRTGWTRDLVRAGVRVVGVDQRGHGASDKPHDPAAYSMAKLVGDLQTVLDTYLVTEAALVGYSLGARVGWHAALEMPQVITRAVLGGIPDAAPLTRFRTDEARAALEGHGAPEDRVTAGYLTMAAAVPGNDVAALVSVVEGLQEDDLRPDPAHAPSIPLLFATGSEDGIIEGSRRLASSTERGRFVEIPGRHHFNAPTSRHFREQALAFLLEG